MKPGVADVQDPRDEATVRQPALAPVAVAALEVMAGVETAIVAGVVVLELEVLAEALAGRTFPTLVQNPSRA